MGITASDCTNGDQTVNAYVLKTQACAIPRVQFEVEKAIGFKVFLDIDMTNSFHQFLLTETSSQRLALQLPWGLVEPVLIPQGVSPASGHLSKYLGTSMSGPS